MIPKNIIIKSIKVLSYFSAFERAHVNRPLGCVMTMMTFRTDDPSSCGIVELDDSGVVVEFHEKVENPPGNHCQWGRIHYFC